MKLSVCITTYNRARALDHTLKSLSVQTRLPDELIISDDCSTDNTSSVVSRWVPCFPLLRYNKNEHNLNMPGNLNAAINLAQGEYIANLHDADEFHPTLLEKWERALDNYPSAGFVFSGVVNCRGHENKPDNITLHDVQPLTPGRMFFEKYFLHKFSSIVWGTVMARQEAYNQLLPFNPSYGFVSDVDMWMRMCQKFDVAYVREPLIILDQSESKERTPNKFNWKWLDTARRMQKANLELFYEDDSLVLNQEILYHTRLAKKAYRLRLLGRLRRFDREGIQEGLSYYKKAFT